MTTDPLAALPLACPRCAAPLDALHCGHCGVTYPVRAGIPWLFADPAHALGEWRNRYDHARARLGAERARTVDGLARARSAQADSRRNGAICATLRRLERLVDGLQAGSVELAALLEPLLGRGGAPLESHVALHTRLPANQGLLTYESNVFRDWCWGAAENRAALDEVLAVLGNRAPRRVLVLGSGAGRLAYDLHQGTEASLTVALDINPLLACVGQRVSRGETLRLTEFPLAPRAPEDAAIERTLAAPAPSRPGLVFVLGDALRPPFATGAFDLVVTPWLLDILDTPAELAMGAIGQVLAPGGAWINHGSVGFGHPDPLDRLTATELLERAHAFGFAIGARSERDLPLLCCPESRRRRLEAVFTFCAERADVPTRGLLVGTATDALPAWLADGRAAVPALPEFRAQALATRTHAYILSLIDGQRSINDIARVLAQHRLIDEAGGRAALRQFFATLHDETRRARAL